MKKGWPEVEIGEAFKTSAGGTPLRSKKQYFDMGTIPWLMSGEVAQREIYSCENFITPLGLENCSARILPVDSVLVAMYGATAGQVGILKFAACTNQAVCAIHPNDRFLPPFVYYALLSQQRELIDSAVGNAQPNLSQIKLRKVRIPVPPLAEQQRIVRILDEAFEGIATAKANAEKNLQNARALFESHLQSVFSQRGEGWVENRLDEVCAITSTLVDPRETECQDLTHVGAGNIESKTGIFVDLKTARDEGLISGKYLFDESMVLYSKIRPYLMKVARPDFKGLCSADMYPLAPNLSVISRDFLFHLLLTKNFTDYAIQGSARAGMPKVNRELLFAFKVWLPDINKQRKLAANLDDLNEETQRLTTIYERKRAALDDLKKSLLHQAFSGNL